MSKSRKKSRVVLLIVSSTVIIAVAAALIVYGVSNLWVQYKVTHNPTPSLSTEVVTNSTEEPDETKPTEACANYTVAAEQPERISLPSLGVEGCIERVGVDQHGAVAVPTNIHVAGWFVDSVLPGEKGLSVIDGHINGNYTSDGIFQHLNTLKTGEKVLVTRGDNAVIEFEVTEVKAVPVENASEELFKKDEAIESQLTLITCGGRFNKDINQFDQRIIVVTKRIS